MAKTTKQILEESRELRFGFKKPEVVAEIGPVSYSKPLPWNYYFGQVLGAVGFSFADTIVSLYLEEGLDLSQINVEPEEITVIIHGHNRREHCATKTLCHVLGYKPNGDESLAVLKRWEKFGYGTSD